MNNNIFPLPFASHVIFCLISLVFFLFQYYRLRYKYQLIMALAIPSTMLIYISSNKYYFYGVGILEVLFLIAAMVAAIKDRKKINEQDDSNKHDGMVDAVTEQAEKSDDNTQ